MRSVALDRAGVAYPTQDFTAVFGILLMTRQTRINLLTKWTHRIRTLFVVIRHQLFGLLFQSQLGFEIINCGGGSLVHACDEWSCEEQVLISLIL